MTTLSTTLHALRRDASTLAALTLTVIGAMAVTPAHAEPFLPARDSEILERVPVRSGQLSAERARLAARPDDLDVAVSVAQEYVAQGSQQADPRYYGRAQAVLAPWWSLPEPPLEVLRLRAQVRQSKHDFDGALADLEALLGLAPRDADAWFARAVIYEVKGEPQRALESCMPLWRLTDALTTTACLASAAALSGRAQQSYAVLAPMIERVNDASGETRAWALTVLAEIAVRTGLDDAAEGHYEDALAAAEPDQYLLSSYADFLLDRGRDEDVRELLADRTQMDALLLRLAIAARRLSATDAQVLDDALGERFAALRARDDRSHLGNEARYELVLRDDPRRALELAQANFAVQREPVDLRILLEAALAAGEPAAAREALDWYARSGLEDTRIAALVDRLADGSL